jgi:hypothetical protein
MSHIDIAFIVGRFKDVLLYGSRRRDDEGYSAQGSGTVIIQNSSYIKSPEQCPGLFIKQSILTAPVA